MADDDQVVADRAGGRATAGQRRYAETAERLNESESCRLVVRKRVTRDRQAAIGRQPDAAGFGNEIADGEDEAVVADDDTVASALRAEDRSSEGIFGDFRAQLHDGVECRVEVEPQLVLPRLHALRKRPAARFGHEENPDRVRSLAAATSHVTRFPATVTGQAGCSLGAMGASRIGRLTRAAKAASPASRYHMTV